jgi:hypothetical protein
VTFARRLATVATALVVLGVASLSAPTTALGATWTRIVAFEESGTTFDLIGQQSFDGSGRNCIGSTAWGQNMHLHPASTQWPVDLYYTNRTLWGGFGQVWTGGGPYGCKIDNPVYWRFDPIAGEDYRFDMWFAKNTNDPWATPNVWWIDATGTYLTAALASQTDSDGGSAVPITTATAPVGAVGIAFHQVSLSSFIVRMTVEGVDWPDAGTCAGIGELAFPAEGLSSNTHPTQWGDFFMADGDPAGCGFSKPGLFRYAPPEGIVGGNVYDIEVQFQSTLGTTGDARVIVELGGAQTGQAVRIADHSYAYDGSGPVTYIIQAELRAPAGYRYFTFVMLEHTLLQSVVVADVTGSVLDQGGDDGVGPGEDNSAFSECQPGSDFLAVGEWVAYAACLIASLPEAIAGFIGSLLTSLFVPVTLGASWASFVDTLEGKVPFGWFFDVADAVSAGLSAPSSGLPSLSFLGVSVTAPLGTALTAMAPYRGLILAGAAILMVTGCIRWIMAAVGVSPAHQAEGS